MDELLAQIDTARVKLREAFAQTNNPAVQQKITNDLSDLADFQDDVIQDGLTQEAATLNRLSDILDQAIKDIQGNVNNLLLGDLVTLRDKAKSEAQSGGKS